MYCNNCGKEIIEGSLFCPYCGEKQQGINSSYDTPLPYTEQQREVSLHPSPAEPRKTANIVADEIVANLKMIGLAFVLSGVFIGIFWFCHIEDRKSISENYYGASCYDDEFFTLYGDYETNWEKIYEEKVQIKLYIVKDFFQNEYGYDFDGSKKARKDLEQLKKNHKSLSFSNEELKKEAQEEAKKNKENLETELNNNRMERAVIDFNNHLKYSILISLALTILGRYLIKSIKWVAKNKTR